MAQPPGTTNPPLSGPEGADIFAPAVVSYRRPATVRQDRGIRIGGLASKRNAGDTPTVVLRIPEIRAVDELQAQPQASATQGRLAAGEWRVWMAVAVGGAILAAVFALVGRGSKHSQPPITPVDTAPTWSPDKQPSYTIAPVPTYKEPSPVVAAPPATESGASEAERLPELKLSDAPDQAAAVADRRGTFGEEARREDAATARPPVYFEGGINTYFDEIPNDSP